MPLGVLVLRRCGRGRGVLGRGRRRRRGARCGHRRRRSVAVTAVGQAQVLIQLRRRDVLDTDVAIVDEAVIPTHVLDGEVALAVADDEHAIALGVVLLLRRLADVAEAERAELLLELLVVPAGAAGGQKNHQRSRTGSGQNPELLGHAFHSFDEGINI